MGWMTREGLPPRGGDCSQVDRNMQRNDRIDRVAVVVENYDDWEEDDEIPTMPVSIPGGLGWIESDRLGKGYRMNARAKGEKEKENRHMRE